MPGKLYIVATPIGNLGDITTRAIDTLKSVDLVLTEDTRVTGKLLQHFDIQVYLLSYHQHSNDVRKFEILKHLIEGKNLAFVTDAGTPGVSDPGNELIDFLLEKEPEIKVVPIPGPSALTTALSLCGFDVSKFKFLGFLPKKGRTKIFTAISQANEAQVFFESPMRLVRTLGELKDYLEEGRRVFVGRELTKLFESTYRGSITDVLEKLEKERVKGEIVAIVEKRH